ncbi:MAG: hypothetical protein HY978_01770 [Candidatus Liptonbacteria bacterium]|nr:hypothetical protein [Candidatus Liptonbacteria bacterium]
MNSAARDFISDEQRSFRFQIGHILASSLSGFIAGAIFASIIWLLAFYFAKMMM